jgi:hypothetical protein
LIVELETFSHNREVSGLGFVYKAVAILARSEISGSSPLTGCYLPGEAAGTGAVHLSYQGAGAGANADLSRADAHGAYKQGLRVKDVLYSSDSYELDVP